MVTVQSISNYDKKHSTVITIGTFDGVHIGHRKILERLILEGIKRDLRSTVLTFFPHPRMVLQKDSDIKLLNTIEEKTEILASLGLDCLIIHPFTKEFSRLTATEFVRDILVNKLNTKKIIIGYDHRFGRNRNANINDLIAFGNTLNFEVEEIPAQEVDEISVSSTKIRNALMSSEIKKANAYLGYEYLLTGTVIRGKGLGRQINFPTANLQIAETYKLIPKNGAYAIKSDISGKTYFGMMNIGINPTVEGKDRSIEVNFFDLKKDLYDSRIQVKVLDHIREEQKFENLEQLKQQLFRDKETALKLISKL